MAYPGLNENDCAAISEAHAKWLRPPAERLVEEPEVAESTITATDAKLWADKVFGHGSVSIIRREGKDLRRVGVINDLGTFELRGEGKTWDEAVRMAGGDPGEIETIRRDGQG